MENRQVTTACGRYAPSPSGALHFGNLRTALLAWLQTRLAGARFIMRMEDLDQPRTRAGSAAQILEDLRWLGLDWDAGPDKPDRFGPYTQSERTGLYKEALETLRENGLVYRCYCSRKDIQGAASAPHGPAGPIYPGTCRGLPVGTERQGGAPAWRFRVTAGDCTIEDEVCGRFSQELSRDVGDFVVRRRDGLYAYQLAVVVDDASMGITDVLRGMDLLDSTPRQVALIKALGFPQPRYWHVPLVMDSTGRRLAKRDSDNLVAPLRVGGLSAAGAVGQLAASAGLIDESREISLSELLESLTLDSFREALRRELQANGSGVE